jgi:hypothetical protein
MAVARCTVPLSVCPAGKTVQSTGEEKSTEHLVVCTQISTQLYIRLYRMPKSRSKQRLEGYIIPLSSVLGPIPQGLHKRFHKR